MVYGFNVLLNETLTFQFQSLGARAAAAAVAAINGMCNYSQTEWLHSQTPQHTCTLM